MSSPPSTSPAAGLALARLPYLGTAEEELRFVEWLVAPGDALRRGQAIAVVETLKAAFEVESEVEGVLLRALVEAGARVPARAAIAVVGPSGSELDERRVAELLAVPPTVQRAPGQPPAEGPPAEVPRAPSPAAPGLAASAAGPAAPAARRRAAELGVELARVPGGGAGGLIRVVDVEAFARSHSAGDGPLTGDGRLAPGFLAELRRDRQAFARLTSELKLAIYRRMGALIGPEAVLAEGAVLLAERLVLGPGAHVGPDSTVEAVELEAGALFHLGARCRLRCRRLRFGDNAFLTDDVEIGGGGAMDPEAELVVGSHGFIGEHVHLNPCRRLVLGDEVVLSRNVSVMTHSFGGSLLRGYPGRFAGVTIGDGAQIGIGAVLFPGVEVGPGAILLSGSSLVSSMPAGRLYGGVPAVDLKAAAQVLTPEDLARRTHELLREFSRQLQLRGLEVSHEEHEGQLRISVRREGRTHVLRFGAEPAAAPVPLPSALAPAEELQVRAAWAPQAWEAVAAAPGLCAIDLERPAIRGPAGPLADSLREFLRKRGVRLHPRTWTYRGGWL